MEPRRGGEHQEEDLDQLVVPGKKKRNKTNGAAASLCPCAAAAALTPPPDSSARQALEQAVLSRADLMQLHPGGGVGAVGDRRRERRMRNRASAERSRARRHAYVNELETEVRLLRQENEQLKRLCDELEEAAEVAQVPPVLKKKTTGIPGLQRTSSSPF